jgi:ribosome recycling factor
MPRWRFATCVAMPIAHLKDALKKKEIGEDDERKALDDMQR